MGERERYEPGTFSWVDLATDDPEAAKAFYAGLFGWQTQDVPMGTGAPYTMCMLRDGAVCAIYGRETEQGPPAWLSYVTVADADASVADARAAGALSAQDAFDVFDAGPERAGAQRRDDGAPPGCAGVALAPLLRHRRHRRQRGADR